MQCLMLFWGSVSTPQNKIFQKWNQKGIFLFTQSIQKHTNYYNIHILYVHIEIYSTLYINNIYIYIYTSCNQYIIKYISDIYSRNITPRKIKHKAFHMLLNTFPQKIAQYISLKNQEKYQTRETNANSSLRGCHHLQRKLCGARSLQACIKTVIHQIKSIQQKTTLLHLTWSMICFRLFIALSVAEIIRR